MKNMACPSDGECVRLGQELTEGENDAEKEELQDRCILSELSGELKKFLAIGSPLPQEYGLALGNPNQPSDRGTHLLYF